MQIQSGQEALYVACEMERGAIQTYERALMLVDAGDPMNASLREHLQMMLNDERQHLVQFQSLYEGLAVAMEQQLMLAAVASSLLFEGGLMGAVRQGMLKDRDSLLRFAQAAEQKAADTYRAFAAACKDEKTADILRGIALEEETHLQTLRGYL